MACQLIRYGLCLGIAICQSQVDRRHPNRAVVKLLLRNGAALEEAGAGGLSPLTYAVKLNRLDTAEALLEAGANVKSLDRNGDGLLMFAINENRVDMTAVLLKGGADPNAPDSNGLSPLYWSEHFKRTDLTHKLLAAGADPGRKKVSVRTGRSDVFEEF